jgi:hypothetical protein|tara:strand:+ start:673 stop:960 length:288 start_codon:yes stop_codon:yes gene_type:complete
MHQDKLRTGTTTKTYRDNHDKIFGPAKGAGELTDQQREAADQRRQDHHNWEVENGKKDAQYYVDHEVRTAANPDFEASRKTTARYKVEYDRIFGR